MPFFALVGGGLGLILLLLADAILQKRPGNGLRALRIFEAVVAGLAAVVLTSVGIPARSALALILAIILSMAAILVVRSTRPRATPEAV